MDTVSYSYLLQQIHLFIYLQFYTYAVVYYMPPLYTVLFIVPSSFISTYLY